MDLSADSASVPLSLDDVEELLSANARVVLRDPTAPRVLLSRVRASMRHDAEEKKRLRADVTRIAEGYKMKSSPLAAAVDALGRLNPREQSEVFTIGAVGLLETLRTQISDARAVRLAAVSAQRRARLVLVRLLEGGNLTAADAETVRSELAVLDGTDIPVPDEAHLPPVGDPVRVAAAGTGTEDMPLANLFA